MPYDNNLAVRVKCKKGIKIDAKIMKKIKIKFIKK